MTSSLKNTLAIIAEALREGRAACFRKDAVMAQEIEDLISGVQTTLPVLRRPEEIQPDNFYLVLARVDEVDEHNSCVHLSSCKASHWYHFQNIFKAPSENIKTENKTKVITKTSA